MNAADAMNAATYALARVEVIASGGTLGMTDWSEEDESARLEEIQSEISKVQDELRSYGIDVEHNV